MSELSWNAIKTMNENDQSDSHLTGEQIGLAAIVAGSSPGLSSSAMKFVEC